MVGVVPGNLGWDGWDMGEVRLLLPMPSLNTAKAEVKGCQRGNLQQTPTYRGWGRCVGHMIEPHPRGIEILQVRITPDGIVHAGVEYAKISLNPSASECTGLGGTVLGFGGGC